MSGSSKVAGFKVATEVKPRHHRKTGASPVGDGVALRFAESNCPAGQHWVGTPYGGVAFAIQPQQNRRHTSSNDPWEFLSSAAYLWYLTVYSHTEVVVSVLSRPHAPPIEKGSER
jgi:hypothetical protein